MSLFKQIAALVSWFALWLAIPAALLYPVALWMLKNTQYSGEVVIQGYGLSVAVLFLPAGFLVHFLYGKLIRSKST
jgi:hypothetical protein